VTATASTLARFEEALRAAGCRSTRPGAWTCPAHDDSEPSLSVREGDDGRVLIHCFGPCDAERIVAALGLTLADLFGPPNSGATLQHPEHREQAHRDGRCTPERNGPQQSQGSAPDCSLDAYATAKRLAPEFLLKLGIREVKYEGGRALRIPYLDEAGEEESIRFRLRVDKLPGGDGRFKWKTGSRAVPYGLWRVNFAQAMNAIVLVEGESDCHVLWSNGIPALGIPGAKNWKQEFASALDGIGTVFVVREPDAAGASFVATLLATESVRDRLRVVDLEDAKDCADLHVRDPEGFQRAFAAALDRSTVAVEEERAQTEREAVTRREVAWQGCADLAQEPSILTRFVKEMQRLGAVGEERAARLIFLAMISRLFKRPVSIVLKGPSSAGKSFTTDQTLRFFPSAAYYTLSGMSERFLVYDPEPLEHRMIVVSEAAGLLGEFATYLVRTLLSEGRFIYGTTEKTEDGEFQGRRIEKRGPTGVILTTTQVKLHPENETRLLSVPVDDTPQQTKRVLEELAKDEDEQEPGLGAWHALQEWLALGEVRVVVPFARKLAEAIDPVAVRLRRDFGALLSLIRAHALLHRASREVGPDGIVATIDDYAAVRELVADLMGEAASLSVPATMRETVEAVARVIASGNEHASVAQVASALKLDKSAASRRVGAATTAGYLENIETKKGVRAKLRLGEPLPAEQQLLPDPEVLQRCSDSEGDREGPPSPPATNDAARTDDSGWSEEWF
jgi:hypothetical protein